MIFIEIDYKTFSNDHYPVAYFTIQQATSNKLVALAFHNANLLLVASTSKIVSHTGKIPKNRFVTGGGDFDVYALYSSISMMGKICLVCCEIGHRYFVFCCRLLHIFKTFY